MYQYLYVGYSIRPFDARHGLAEHFAPQQATRRCLRAYALRGPAISYRLTLYLFRLSPVGDRISLLDPALDEEDWRAKTPEMEVKTVALVLFCAAGIYTAYLTQGTPVISMDLHPHRAIRPTPSLPAPGLVQERLQVHTYGQAKEHFPDLTFLQGAQAVACFAVGGILLVLGRLTGLVSSRRVPPVDDYLKPAVTNTIGPACGILALRNISYPAQVLVKSCKPLAVMVSGALFYGRVYSAGEYLCMGLVAAGISIFGWKNSSKTTSKLARPNVPLGYSLCLLNLLLDGFTNASQDEIKHHYPEARDAGVSAALPSAGLTAPLPTAGPPAAHDGLHQHVAGSPG